MCSHASVVPVKAWESLLNRRQRPSHASVRSTTHLRVRHLICSDGWPWDGLTISKTQPDMDITQSTNWPL